MPFSLFKKKNNHKPDYSEIDSNEKAALLYINKVVAKMHLMPLEFGGKDSPVNTLYAPVEAVELKTRFDAMIEELLEQGKELSYSAEPGYKGKSFIPNTITIRVSGDADFIETIHIW